MKVYTRTGDAGTTSLVGGTRVAKHSARLEAYGTIDEANSWLGLLYTSEVLPEGAKATLLSAMHRLFDIGAALATEPQSKWQPAAFDAKHTGALESAIDALEGTLPRHNKFILPTGHPDAARANIARTVVRRAERAITALMATTDGIESAAGTVVAVDAGILRYVNRLSDYLFVLSRAINHQSATPEVFWEI